jgi:nucleoid-associated protein YgaU
MPKDVKTGMLIGLVIAAGLALWFSSISEQNISDQPDKGSIEQNIRYERELPDTNQPQNLQKESKTGRLVIHTVQENQTLSGISKKYYGSSKYVGQILKENKLENPDKIKPGMRLKIPLKSQGD